MGEELTRDDRKTLVRFLDAICDGGVCPQCNDASMARNPGEFFECVECWKCEFTIKASEIRDIRDSLRLAERRAGMQALLKWRAANTP